MYKNAHYDMKRSRMYVWDQYDGVNDYSIVDWVPYVFVPDEDGRIKTIDGKTVTKKDFNTFQEYKEYQKDHRSRIYENEVPREVQFLSEMYSGIADDQIVAPSLKIYSIDIEVHSDRGFPHPMEAAHPIVLINVREFGGGINKTFGIKEYDGEWKDRIDYVYCSNEMELMSKFFTWWNRNAPDAVTGWNIAPNNKMNVRGGFDLPYIVQRSKNLFGKKADVYKKLSPINIVRNWEDKEGALYVDIAGVSVLDYLSLYKWYTQENPENYKLDTISRFELELGKLDYSEYKDLRTLFHQNWNLYVEYNYVDNQRIEELEDKLGYINLAQNLALLCRCRMENFTSSTNLVEGLMLTHYRRNKLCAPRMVGGHQEWYPAAYVKPPQVGQHDWIVDLDIASSYPTAIITLNMSPETYYGRCIAYAHNGSWVDTLAGRDDMEVWEIAEKEIPIAEFVTRREFPPFKLMRDTGITIVEGRKLESFNKALKAGLICVAPCGTMFLTNKQGHFAQVERETFLKRKNIKGLMKEAFLAGDKVRGKNLFSLQWALKIVLNSAYGVTGVPYSRYFNVNISEAIASCGRRSIMGGQKYVNRWFQEDVWKENERLPEILSKLGEYDTTVDFTEDMVAYIDTDSVFIRLGHFLDRVMKDDYRHYEDDHIIAVILELSKEIECYVNDCAFIETQVGEYNSQVDKETFSIVFKQEIVCKSALFITPKKYGYHLVNEEGVPKDKIDVTGLEIIRSETPSGFKDALRDMLGMILRSADDDTIYDTYVKYKKEARDLYPEEISENKGIGDIDKWIKDGYPMKGTPYHVKAVYNYHRLIKELEIDDIYPEIHEDSKQKLAYVKPNPYGVKTVMYDRYPPEFVEAGILPDYDKMIDKFLTNKLRMLLAPAGREHILDKNLSFDIFFGG